MFFHDYWTLSDSIISQKDHNVDVISLSIVEHAIYAQYENNWYIANVSIIFDAPCLFYINSTIVLYMFWCVFISFLELTYWQDAEVPVPVFCCFWFQKSYTGNILGNGRDKNQKSYICRGNTENRSGDETEQQGDHTTPRRGLALARAWGRWGHPGHRLTPPLRLFNPRHGYTLSTRAQFHENHRRRRHRQP